MNGHVLEYTTLSGSGHINGSVPRGYGHSGPLLPQGCHHLHHKLPNGLPLLNGTSSLYTPGHPHGHDGTLAHSPRECDHSHSHPHHHHNVSAVIPYSLPQHRNEKITFSCVKFPQSDEVSLLCYQGGGIYTALPQTESSDCMSCQNLCNNNR